VTFKAIDVRLNVDEVQL